MNSADDTVAALLTQSLTLWRAEADIERGGAGLFLIRVAAHDIRIERAPSGVPFRWMVTVSGRRRGAASLVGVLRQMRSALDPGYAEVRVRIAPVPLASQ